MYIFSIEVRLWQWVSLKRDPSIEIVGTTWENSGMSFTPTNEMPKKIREAATIYIDAFINDYLAVNPNR